MIVLIGRCGNILAVLESWRQEQITIEEPPRPKRVPRPWDYQHHRTGCQVKQNLSLVRCPLSVVSEFRIRALLATHN
jgi:hypothetical protein